MPSPFPPSPNRTAASGSGGVVRAAPPDLQAAQGTAQAAGDSLRPVLARPASRIEPALGLVVLEFQDITGEARTIPSARELDAYRSVAGGLPARQAESSPPGAEPTSAATAPQTGGPPAA